MGNSPSTKKLDPDDLLAGVPANVVQAVRAFRAETLREEASRLGHRFYHAHCSSAAQRQQVFGLISEALGRSPEERADFLWIRQQYIANLTRRMPRSKGYIVLLERLPQTKDFSPDAREKLLEIFADAAEYWRERGVPFRVFYSFSGAASPASSAPTFPFPALMEASHA